MTFLQKMVEKLDSKGPFTFKELLMSEVIQSEALINLFDCKGIITKKELVEEMIRMQASLAKKGHLVNELLMLRC